MAHVAENLPGRRDLTFNSPKVHELNLNLDNPLKVNEAPPKGVKTVFVNAVKDIIGQGTDASKRLVKALKTKKDLTVGDLYAEVQRALIKSEHTTADIAKVNREINYQLREAGYDALTNDSTTMLLDNSKARVINSEPLTSPDHVDAKVAEYNRDSVAASENPNIPSAQVNHAESSVRLQAQLIEETNKKLESAKAEQLRNLAAYEQAERELKAASRDEKVSERDKLTAERNKQVRDDSRRLNHPVDDPCQF
jgi:hypothetical protein